MARISPPHVSTQCETRFQNGDSRHQILNADGVFKRSAPNMREALILAGEDDIVVSRQKPKGYSAYQWVLVSPNKHVATDDSRRIEKAFKLAPELKELIAGLIFGKRADEIQPAIDRANKIVNIVGRETFRSMQ